MKNGTTDRVLKGRFKALALGVVASVFATGVLAKDAPNPFAGVSANYDGIDTLKPMTLRWSDFFSPTSSASLGSRAFMDYVSAATDGKVKFEPYWSNALFSPAEAPASIASGIADIGPILPGYTPAKYPINNWFGGFGVEAKGGAPYGSLIIAAAGGEFFASNESIKAEFVNAGLHVLGVHGNDSYDMLCTSPIASLADAKGKNVRTGGQVHADEVTALGMVPVPIASSETYEAITRGLVDCTVQKPDQYFTGGLTDIKGDLYWIDLELSGFVSAALAINNDIWMDLPPVLQQILTDASMKFLVQKAAGVQVGTVEFGKLIEAGKIHYVKPDDELLSALTNFQETRLEEMVAEAPAGVTDPAGAVKQFRALTEKWRDVVSNELKISPIPTDVAKIPAYWSQDFDFDGYAERLSKELGVGVSQ